MNFKDVFNRFPGMQQMEAKLVQAVFAFHTFILPGPSQYTVEIGIEFIFNQLSIDIHLFLTSQYNNWLFPIEDEFLGRSFGSAIPQFRNSA
jgi:hypothetical protein